MLTLGAILIPISRERFPVLYEQPIGIRTLTAILAIWWLRSLIGIFANWSEPDARILRFTALGVLALSGLIIAALMG